MIMRWDSMASLYISFFVENAGIVMDSDLNGSRFKCKAGKGWCNLDLGTEISCCCLSVPNY